MVSSFGDEFCARAAIATTSITAAAATIVSFLKYIGSENPLIVVVMIHSPSKVGGFGFNPFAYLPFPTLSKTSFRAGQRNAIAELSPGSGQRRFDGAQR